MVSQIESIQPRKDFLDLPLNVGFEGGDLPARYFAALMILTLVVVAAPPAQVSYKALKISTLLISMSGTILLMAALVFSQKTHYAGMLLIAVSFLILGLAGLDLKWPGVVIGLAFLGWVAQNLVTRRCGVNKLLGINSCEREAKV
jgi:hypothetical protein